jgi:hypothetical protein
MKTAVIIILVAAAVLGGLLTLRTMRNTGMPDKDVLDRAKQRERAIRDEESRR